MSSQERLVPRGAFVLPDGKITIRVPSLKRPIYRRNCVHHKQITCSNTNDSFSWEGWKLGRLFRQFLKKTGHFPLHERNSYVFPQPDSVLKLPPAKSTPEQEFQKFSEEARFKYSLEIKSSPTAKPQEQLVSISSQNATLFGQLIQYSQDRSKVWIRPLLLMEQEIDAFHLEGTKSVRRNYYSLVNSQDLLLSTHLVTPYNNGLTGLLNILQETVAKEVGSSRHSETTSQVLFRFLQSLQQ